MSPEPSALDIVLAYHQRTKHRFERYAPGPDTLDWDDQPAAFRRFDGAPEVVLPTLAHASEDIRTNLDRPFHQLHQAPALAADVSTLAALLQLSLAVNAWKTYGPNRWSVRVNPSSGNLHPIEAYVLVQNWPGLADGLYHYRPDDHVLELRAKLPQTTTEDTPRLSLALSSVMWREAWKYGERAFRYCQLDTGHAVAAVAYAAAVLGWHAAHRPMATDRLAQLLGLDRDQEFPASRHGTEREEPELLLDIRIDSAAPQFGDEQVPSHWYGRASVIDRHPFYHWPIIDEVAIASRFGPASVGATAHSRPPTLRQAQDSASAYQVINGRRSAQRFDARHEMDQASFLSLLRCLQPGDVAPWSSLTPEQDALNLLLFVHRVQGLNPGLYLLPLAPDSAGRLQQALAQRFSLTPVCLNGEASPLLLLESGEPSALKRLARALHCHQDLAANACFALGMVAEFAPRLAQGPWVYRQLLRQAGLAGQVLYLEAEAHGLRGTGIGCFFDDPLHELLELDPQRAAFQTLYHFTVGQPLDDPRIESSPPRFAGDDLP